MTRQARVVLPGVAHHITQRGIRRLNTFGDDEDRIRYLSILGKSCARFGLRICAYCLMSNHVHFVAVPERRDSIWKTFHRCHSIYAEWFNEKYHLSGHLWQGRPFSCCLSETHFWAAMRYVEFNPVRAGIVNRPEEYRWSSAQAHCGLRDDALLDREWLRISNIPNWSAWLMDDAAAPLIQEIRERTMTGKPCGDNDFIKMTETVVGRQLTPKRPGPKRSNRK
jgi:putative transposase